MQIEHSIEEFGIFFSGLKSGLDAHKKIRDIYNERIAFDFNSLDFFKPGENKISELLGFYLNPNGTHGQGDSFLLTFLEHKELEKAYKAYRGEAKVYLELTIDGKRRIDIVIEIGKGEYYIGIENKVGTAPDQKRQLSDYSNYLSEISNQKYFLFYLTPSGHEPSQYTLSKDELEDLQKDNKFSTLSYKNDIIDLFTKFEGLCKADSVRAFTRDLNQYLKKRFRGEKFMDEYEYITNFLDDSQERQHTALSVAFAKWHFLDKLYLGFKEELFSKYVEKYKIIMEKNVWDLIDSKAKICLIKLQKKEWEDTWVSFEFSGANGKSIIHGIVHEDHNGKLDAIQDFHFNVTQPDNKKHYKRWVTCEEWNKDSYDDWHYKENPWRKMIKDRNGSSALFQEMSVIIDDYFKALEKVDQDLL